MVEFCFAWIEAHSQGIQALSVSLSAVTALIVYWRNSASQRRIALVNMIIQFQSDEKMKEVGRTVRKLYSDGGNSLKCYVDKDGEERKAILTLANHYEFMAVAIRYGAFDEDTYKSLEYSNVMRNWNVLKDFVEEARSKHGNHTWFQDFEKLANRWKKKPLETIR